jgi:large repetitive protein
MAAVAVATAIAVPATVGTATAAPAENTVLRALVFTKNTSHDSATQQRTLVATLLNQLAAQYGGQTVDIQTTDDAGQFNDTNLANKDLVIFSQNGGVLFNTDQRTALEKYVRNGGGWFGMHYNSWSRDVVSESEANPFYLQLMGAQSNDGHPEPAGGQSGRVYLADKTGSIDPLTAGLAPSIVRTDEWYNWDVNPTQNVHVLNYVDESSYAAQSGTVQSGEGQQGTAHPMTWCQKIDSGRSWFSGMGHSGASYSEPYMVELIKRGLAYTAGLLPADCSPPSKGTEGAWSDVTPWPLMPINVSLTADGKIQSFGSVGGWGTDTTPFDFSGDSSITQGGQTEVDVWDPTVPRTLANYRNGLIANKTYTDLFCSMQVQNPYTDAVMTVGGDDSLGGNAPNDAAIGTTSFTTDGGIVDAAPMNYPRWYPTGTTTADGDIIVQGGSLSGGPGGNGVLTPEIYRPREGTGWKLLTGAKSALAYGDGGNGNGPDENRWWYPRSFVAPDSGKIFTITGTEMFALDAKANGGTGAITDAQTLPTNVSNQGTNGNPVGATSTAVMYRPGKILQVGGGWWANGGGPAGSRAGFTVDITGGTANPVVKATTPMTYQRHWGTATVLPDGNVIVTGGARDNNGDGGFVTTAEIWNPDSGEWKTVENPSAHPRLYHSTAILLPDGRLMIGGGGGPGPHNYTDVEYYSPSYLYNQAGQAATRPLITSAPKKIGYNGTFGIQSDSTISRVTLVRNGTVTHGFNNGQNFQDLQFTQSGGNVSITSPKDGTYAPPGSYMLFAFNADGTPSVAKIVKISPTVKMEQIAPTVVDQFEYPKLPTEWRGANPPNTIDVAPGNGRMAPWKVNGQVQLVRGTVNGNGGLGLTGYQLSVPATGDIERTLRGLAPGHDYRVSLRYARDSRTAGTTPAAGRLTVGSLDATLTATTDNPSRGALTDTTYGTYVGTFTASAKTQTLRLAGAAGAGLMIDDLVVVAQEPGLDSAAVRYEFEEGNGTTVANTGTDDSVGSATLTGTTGWSAAEGGVFGRALNLPGGTNTNAVDLPDNLLQNQNDFTTSFWVRPDTKADWINLFHIGSGTGDAGSFFQIQMQTQVNGATGLTATFQKKGSGAANLRSQRVYATPTKDVDVNKWNHVVFTRTGATGTLYLNGVQIAQRTDLTISMTDVGATENNWLGRNAYPDPAFDGLMDDVRLYTTAISGSDVASLYSDGSALRTTTTVSVTPGSPSTADQPLSVTAQIKGSDNNAAQGTADLSIDDAPVASGVAVSGGAVTFPAQSLKRGDHEIKVSFTPAEGWRASTGSVTQTVLRATPAAGVPIHYTFDEESGANSANSGTDTSVGNATLDPSWRTTQGKFGGAVNLPGGAGNSGNQVVLPNDLADGMTDEFSVSIWANPRALPNWVPLLQIGSSTDTFFLLQSSTQANGATGFAATFKQAGNANQERLLLGGGNDLPLNKWTHVVFTLSGGVGKIYFDGQLKATRNDFTLGIDDVGVNGHTTANFLGGTSWGDPRFNGLVDEFQMFGHELSPEEVTALTAGPPPSSKPVASADRYRTAKGQPLTVPAPGVLANDTDADSTDLTATGATQPAHGTVALAANGSFTYTPTAGYVGADTFTYRASDGTNESEPATVTVVVAPPAGVDAPVVRFSLDEGTGQTGANSGWDDAVGKATLTGDAQWIDDPDRDTVVNLPGGASTTNNHVVLPNNLTQDVSGDFSVSIWANPRALPNWVPLLQIGNSTDSFFLLQSSTQANGASGFAATFKEAGNADQERLTLGGGNDLPLNKWTQVVFTMKGHTGRIYLDGVLKATRTDFTLGLDDIAVNGRTTANFIGGTSWPDGRFNGLVDDFRLYGHELSAAEIGELFSGKAPEPATTQVSGTAPAFTYGAAGSVSATVTPATATGRVEVLLGSRVLGSGTISSGRARIALAAKALVPGNQRLTVRYVGDADHAASSGVATVTVRKASPRLVLQAPGSVKVGRAGTVSIALAAPGAVTVTGPVTVKVVGKVKVGSKVRSSYTLTGRVVNGKVTFRLPKAAKAGKLKITVTYGGSSLTTNVAGSRVIKVKR